MSDSLRPHGLQPPRLLHPWDFPGKSTGVGCHFLLQGRTFFEAETPILWPPDVKCWLVWKDPDAGKDWGQEEKGRTEDEVVGWHHRLDGHGFGWTPGVSDGQDAWCFVVQGVAKSWIWLTELNWTESYTGLPWWLSKDCLQCGRPGFDPWVGKIPWRIFLPPEWQPTPVFLPGESPWTEEILAGYCPWGHRVRQLSD